MKIQTFEEFVAEERKILDEFYADWIHSNKVNPGEYPMQMSEGEWFEQITAWKDMHA